ncbi:FRAS1-related extracellular matrix protein 2, partial [Geodia barretti]
CIREDAGTLVIPIERRGSLIIQSRLSVATRPSSPVEAVAGVDYTHYESNFNYRGGIRQDTLKFVYIPIIDDTIEEARESFEVTFTPTRNFYLRNNVIKVIICDDDGDHVDPCICDEVPIEVWFEPSAYTVNEASGTVTLTIRTNIAGGPPVGTLSFGTRDGTATAESDYTSTTMYEVMFGEGSFTASVAIPIIDNSIGEGEEKFYGSLATIGDANVLITQDTAEIHIIDNDVEVWFQPTAYTAGEATGTITVTIKTNLAGGPEDGSVVFTTVNGSATAPSDYITTTYDVTFEATSYSTTVTIQVVDDSIGEPEEVFYGSLSLVGSSPVNITEDRANILITDDDIRVWFEPTFYTVNESSATVTLIVRTNVPGGPPLGEVEFYTVDNTAISSGDFIEVLGFPVRFPEGSFTTRATVMINDDNILEENEVFLARLRHVGVETINIVGEEARVMIADNDIAVMGFSPSEYTINEQGSFVVLNVVNRNPNLEREVVVQIGTLSGSAEEGSDFIGSVQTITFTSGSTSDSVSVYVIDDEAYEGTEDFYATLTTIDTSVRIFEDNANIRIIDNDVKVFFDVDTYEVSEANGSVELCVRREGDISRSLTIQVTSGDFNSQQAADGNDYQAFQQSVTFGTDENRACFSVVILDDSLSEGPENFIARIVSETSGFHIGTPDTTIVSIADDESLIIDFVASEYTVSEDESVVSICLRTNTGIDEPVNVIITTRHISTSDGDYDTSAKVVIISASPEASVTCTDIAITDDTIVEWNEDFHVAFEIPPGTIAKSGVFNVTRIVIVDDDEARIGFNPSSYTVEESAGIVIFEVENMTPVMERDVIVQFYTSDGSASDGSDFIGVQSIFSHTLTFSAAETKKYVIVPVMDDTIFEGSEVFYGHLVTQHSGVSITEQNATVVITDNDFIEIGFTPNSYIIEEGETAVLFIENRYPDMETEVTVRVEFTSGTATVQEDFVGSAVNVTLLPGDTQVKVSVPTTNDVVLETTEEFYARATLFISRVSVFESSASILIQDNDEVWVSFESDIYLVDEDRGPVVVCIAREGEISETLTVQVSTSELEPLEAKAGDDFLPISGVPIQFRPDQYRTCFPIAIVNDDEYEGFAENFTVTIATLPLGVSLGESYTTTISILDNDKLEPISAELCGDVCDRLDRIDALLDKICDKLNIQGDQLVEVLRLFSNTLPEK